MDGDGVPDAADVCPRVAGPDWSAGCPADEGAAVAERDRIALRTGLQFHTGKAQLETDSAKAIQAVAKILLLRPALGTRLRIEAHSDNAGSECAPHAGPRGRRPECAGRPGRQRRPARGHGLRKRAADRPERDSGRPRAKPPCRAGRRPLRRLPRGAIRSPPDSIARLRNRNRNRNRNRSPGTPCGWSPS